MIRFYVLSTRHPIRKMNYKKITGIVPGRDDAAAAEVAKRCKPLKTR